MENLENNVVTEEVQVQDTETQEQVKTFTQEEVNEMIAKRIAREAKKIEAEKEKAMQLKLKAELEESEKLAKMSEAERVKAQAEKERKLFEEERKKHLEERRQFEEEKILRLTMEALEDKKLPGSFAKFLKVDTADDIMENISVFEKGFNDAVEKAVMERLRGKTPTTGISKNSTFSMDQLRGMSAEEINKNWANIKNNLK